MPSAFDAPRSASTRPMPTRRRDLTQILLSMICIGALVIAAFWIVRPFIAATIWATTIVVVTWPLMLRVEARLWKSRWLAITVMMVALLVVFLVPLALLIGTIVSNSDEIADEWRSLLAFHMPDPPSWLIGLPLVGEKIAGVWQDTAAAGAAGLWARLAPYAGSVTGWLVARAGGIGFLTVQYLLTLILAAFIYANGEHAALAARRFGHRLGGKDGENLVRLAGQATRAVAIGVGVTAIVQSILGGIGLAIAGVPFALLLTAVLFVLCIAQIGMLVVLIPAVIWVYATGHPLLGTFLLVWSLVASLIDNVLRPMLVRRSADVPLLLIFVGVIGGLIAFGLLGIVVGPVVLAVAYTVLETWMKLEPAAAPPR
jgi:predicted PurR-regulated permease PerM